MDRSQLDAMYCVLGELYFTHIAAQRKNEEQIAKLTAHCQEQLNQKDQIIQQFQNIQAAQK